MIARLMAKLEKGPEHTMPMEEPWVLPSMLNPASEDSNHSHCSPEPTEEHFLESAQQTESCQIKPATLNDFMGDRTKGRAFLNSCNLYIRLAPTQFTDDQAKIMWAFLFIKSNQAARFIN
jgi:hypothetical protein